MNVANLNHINPGDMVMWVYCSTGLAVEHDEKLWSTTLDKAVSIGGLAIMISVDRCKIAFSWMSDKGIFSALFDDEPYFIPLHPNPTKRKARSVKIQKVC